MQIRALTTLPSPTPPPSSAQPGFMDITLDETEAVAQPPPIKVETVEQKLGKNGKPKSIPVWKTKLTLDTPEDAYHISTVCRESDSKEREKEKAQDQKQTEMKKVMQKERDA